MLQRRELLKRLGLGAAAIGLGPATGFGRATKRKPNVVFNITDDQTVR